MENLKEFEELIERYETITIEEIEKYSNQDGRVSMVSKTTLTGFGTPDNCTLCLAIANRECEGCAYTSLVQDLCCHGDNANTYEAVQDARSPGRLKEAYRNRALHMKTILEKWKT